MPSYFIQIINCDVLDNTDRKTIEEIIEQKITSNEKTLFILLTMNQFQRFLYYFVEKWNQPVMVSIDKNTSKLYNHFNSWDNYVYIKGVGHGIIEYKNNPIAWILLIA